MSSTTERSRFASALRGGVSVHADPVLSHGIVGSVCVIAMWCVRRIPMDRPIGLDSRRSDITVERGYGGLPWSVAHCRHNLWDYRDRSQQRP